MLENYKIILASNSPRRQELLKGLDLNFSVKTIPNIDETYPETLKGEEIPLFLAEKKAEAYKQIMEDDTLIITADTIVWHKDRVFGKPKDKEDALEMLKSLSDDIHTVFTGVCVMSNCKKSTFVVASEVKFSKLSDEEISFYVDKYKPFDKAGSYGVQEWIGYVGVEHISGSFYNIMGLPVQRLYQELKKF